MARKVAIGSAALILLAAPFVATWEGTEHTTYLDVVNVPTACTGETGPHITLGQRFSAAECQLLLGASLQRHASELAKCIKAPLADHEAVAVLSWAYNVGTANACASTLVKKINAGQPFCAELDKWVYAKGKRIQGLANRRAAERRLCEGTQ